MFELKKETSSKVAVGTRLQATSKRQLEILAQQNGLTVSDVASQMIEFCLKQVGEQKKEQNKK